MYLLPSRGYTYPAAHIPVWKHRILPSRRLHRMWSQCVDALPSGVRSEIHDRNHAALHRVSVLPWAPFQFEIRDARPTISCRTILRPQFVWYRTHPQVVSVFRKNREWEGDFNQNIDRLIFPETDSRVMANSLIITQYMHTICVQKHKRPVRHIKCYSIFDITLGPCLQPNKMSCFFFFLSMLGSANY